jgi:hypothetical protein
MGMVHLPMENDWQTYLDIEAHRMLLVEIFSCCSYCLDMVNSRRRIEEKTDRNLSTMAIVLTRIALANHRDDLLTSSPVMLVQLLLLTMKLASNEMVATTNRRT